MNEQPITFRAARPDREDGLLCGRFADVASEGFMQVMLGRRAEEIIASAFTEPEHDLSYQNVTFAVLDGVVVGMILAYTAAQHRLSSRDPLRAAAGRFRLRMRVVEILLAPVMRLNDSIEDGDFYLQFIAVDSDLRIGGVGSALMDEFEAQGRAQGATRLSLDVSTSNDVAREFYEHRGWEIESTWPKLWFMPGLSFRMIKPLA